MPLRALLTKLNQDPNFTELCQRLESGEKAHAWITGLAGSGRAFFWAGVWERVRRPLLLLAATPTEARTLYDQLRLFLEHPDPEREELFFFPGREILPYERALADMEVEGERLEVLWRLLSNQQPLVVAAYEQVREVLPDPAWMLDRALSLTAGQHLDLEKMAGKLVERGYVREAMVEARGQFAIRGGILDIFPPAELFPWRVEFEGSEIASLRRFNLQPQSVTSPAPVNEVLITPARIFAPTKAEIASGLAGLERERGRNVVRKLREELEEDCFQPGAENYLPEFIPTATLLDYFSPNAIVVADSPGHAREQSEEDQLRVQQMYAEHRRRDLLLPAPDRLFKPFAELGKQFSRFTFLESGRLKQTVWEEPEFLQTWTVVLKGTTPLRGNLDLLIQEAQALWEQGLALQVVCHNRAEERRLKQLLTERAVNLNLPDWLGRMEFHLGQLDEGFQYPAAGLVVFTDQEIFNRRLGRPEPRRKKGSAYASQPIADVLELKVGDLAVHQDHGLARYLGVVKLRVDGGEQEFLLLAYAGDEKLYVPTDQIRLVEKYIGGDHAPKIYRLGSSAWEKTKQRVRQSVALLARQLLDIYAARQVHSGYAFSPDNTWQKEFEGAFAYAETPDQIRAIAEVKKDMESPRPMDRLICGDVGFGKTEVAMRAAFKAVQDGHQVAVLVPTTILTDQHYATFRERMAAYPIRIEFLSRFRKPAEQKAILRELAQGGIDIIIGTHKLLNQKINFQKLGLFVLDEEQHFGVLQKEKLKELRRTVDVLTLTATPIPRTLYLSLSGIRDISVIETPPLNRLAIRTTVMEYSETVIREAILRELGRGGQVFFIHNRVQTMGQMAERVKRLVPQARVAVAHGQMGRDELEPVMERFLARAEDILVSTTIVESGLDMPNVNTIIINRADALGMAQLYQLRGRVGRADRQAYAYLFYPQGGAVTGDAEKRLSTLQEFTELGSGIKIAMRDLEIRGAGDILGPEQSGQVAAVGFETYCHLLEDTVRELRGQREEELAEVKLSLPLDAYLSSDYVPDTMMRLNLYKRISGIKAAEELVELTHEIEMRFGPLPSPVATLLAVADLKLMARKVQVREIRVQDRTVLFKWPEFYRLKSEKLERLLASAGRRWRFIPGSQPALEIERPPGELLPEIKNFLSELI